MLHHRFGMVHVGVEIRQVKIDEALSLFVFQQVGPVCLCMQQTSLQGPVPPFLGGESGDGQAQGGDGYGGSLNIKLEGPVAQIKEGPQQNDPADQSFFKGFIDQISGDADDIRPGADTAHIGPDFFEHTLISRNVFCAESDLCNVVVSGNVQAVKSMFYSGFSFLVSTTVVCPSLLYNRRPG